jgi:thioesterase domain-containing protein
MICHAQRLHELSDFSIGGSIMAAAGAASLAATGQAVADITMSDAAAEIVTAAGNAAAIHKKGRDYSHECI